MVTTPDLFGLALLEYSHGRREPVHLRREDGRLAVLSLDDYFLQGGSFPSMDAALLRLARGRVLDLGAGGGRVASHLCGTATCVTSLDSSPGVCECLRLQGLGPVVEASWQAAATWSHWQGAWDTVVALGTGLGMAATAAGLSAMCAAFAAWLRPGGLGLVSAIAPSGGEATAQTRLRIEYRGLRGEWFQWLYVSPDHLESLARDAGLEVTLGPVRGYQAEYGVALGKLSRLSSREA